MSIIWFGLLATAFFVFVVLPQRRKLAAFAEMQRQLVEGDDVILTSGIYGTIVALADEQVDVQIAPDVVVRVARAAIGQVRALPDDDAATTDAATTDAANGATSEAGA